MPSMWTHSKFLFLRLLTAAGTTSEDISDIFKYELCSIPSSMFYQSGLPRLANKPILADVIWTSIKDNTLVLEPPRGTMNCIIDGGSPIQKIPWARGVTFKSACKLYVDYCKKINQPTIVFDGYQSRPSTKDVTHLRRCKNTGAQVNFDINMVIATKKENFLSNQVNKQSFVNMLSQQ